MIVVVNDANILIDLVKLELVDAFFNLNWVFYSTDLIIENELYEEQKIIYQPYIESGKFNIQKFDEADMQRIWSIQIKKPQLSDNDCSALYCAQKLKGILVTSDHTLRKYALIKKINVHGHLWVFETLLDQNCITHQLAIIKLNELIRINPRLGLPEEELKGRIKKWEQIKNNK